MEINLNDVDFERMEFSGNVCLKKIGSIVVLEADRCNFVNDKPKENTVVNIKIEAQELIEELDKRIKEIRKIRDEALTNSLKNAQELGERFRDKRCREHTHPSKTKDDHTNNGLTLIIPSNAAGFWLALNGEVIPGQVGLEWSEPDIYGQRTVKAHFNVLDKEFNAFQDGYKHGKGGKKEE